MVKYHWNKTYSIVEMEHDIADSMFQIRFKYHSKCACISQVVFSANFTKSYIFSKLFEYR